MTANLSDTLPVDRSSRRQNFDEGTWAVPSLTASDGVWGKWDAGAVDERSASSLPDRRVILLRSCSDLEGRPPPTRIRQPLASEDDAENTVTLDVDASCNLPTVGLESLEVLGCPAPNSLVRAEADRQPTAFEAGRFGMELSCACKSKGSEVFV